MKATINLLFLLVFCTCSVQGYGKDIESVFRSATVQSDYSSKVTLRIADNVTELATRKWIHENKSFFFNTDSIVIKSTTLWYYGATQSMVTYISFITAENGPKRKAVFDEIKRKREEALQAEIKKREDAIRAENDRLALIKAQIENGSFTGKHYYFYPEGKYEGEFVNGKREGNGRQALANEEWYEGSFKNDLFHGKGTYRQGNGIRYYGEFVNGQRHGVFTAKRWNIFESLQWEAKYDHGTLVYENFPNAPSSSAFDCEERLSKDYSNLNKSAIKFGTLEDYYGEMRQSVKFPDGVSGYIFFDSSKSSYYISPDGLRSTYYINRDATVKALYIFKKCDTIPLVGRK